VLITGLLFRIRPFYLYLMELVDYKMKNINGSGFFESANLACIDRSIYGIFVANMNLNHQFAQILQSPTVAVSDRVLALTAGGRKIISLHVGDPDFPTPQAVVDEAMRAVQNGLTHYGPSRGFPELRQAIAEKLATHLSDAASVSQPYDPDHEILVTHGGVHAYYLALQSILNPGDEVLVPDPSWGTHANMVRQLRGMAVHVPASAENNFIPPLSAWKKYLTPKTRAVVINYPANPTGVIPPREYLQELLNFACEHDLWVISDEVYENLYYAEKPVSAGAFPEMRDHVILVNSLSKTYAMTGWRVGYLAAPQPVIENALKASQNSITCVAPFIQKAAAFALSDPQVQTAAADMRKGYARRREMVLRIAREFGESPLRVIPPQGAFYFFLDMRALQMPSVEICERILDDKGVGLVPGTAFGKQGEGFVRMSIAASDEDVAAGFKAILEWAGAG
jgi:aspartate aminotransferase